MGTIMKLKDAVGRFIRQYHGNKNSQKLEIRRDIYVLEIYMQEKDGIKDVIIKGYEKIGSYRSPTVRYSVIPEDYAKFQNNCEIYEYDSYMRREFIAAVLK
jgi:hypothetical protein